MHNYNVLQTEPCLMLVAVWVEAGHPGDLMLRESGNMGWRASGHGAQWRAYQRYNLILFLDNV